MQKHIKALFKGNIFFIAIGVTILIGVLSLIRLTASATQVSHLDKLQHAFAYCVLALSWLLAIVTSKEKMKLKAIVALGCVIYGIVLEVLQTAITSYRTASLLDILANTVGIFIALLIFKTIFNKFNAN